MIIELFEGLGGADANQEVPIKQEEQEVLGAAAQYYEPAPQVPAPESELADLGQEMMAQITGFGTAGNLAQNLVPKPIDYSKVRVKILEQPASNKLRFRYECEGRSAGALQGASSTNDNKTYPTIQIEGYKGPAVVVVSCVEEKPPHRAHPHNIVGKGSICKKGVCSMEITNEDMTCSFANIGIQCVRKKDAPASLARREQIKVDPYRQGFAHKNSPAINLNAVRLCFQVFLKDQPKLRPLAPVVSNVIYDKKSHSELQIIEISDDTSPVEGGKKIMIFSEKVDKNDIEVHFSYQAEDSKVIESKAIFAPTDVHKQYGIAFKTPPFHDLNITEPVLVSLQLFKPSDSSTSEPMDFYYTPSVFRETKPPVMLAPVFAAPLPARPVAASPEFNQNFQAPKQVQKRGREARQVHDEPSSGQVNVPPKVSTAQLRGGGGQVTVVAEAAGPSIKQDPMKIDPQEMLWSNQPPVAAGNPNYNSYKGTSFVDVVTKSGHHQLNDLEAATRAGGASASVAPSELNDLTLNTSELVNVVDGFFPDLQVTSADLNGEVEDLSNNISDLRLEARSSARQQQQPQQQQQQQFMMFNSFDNIVQQQQPQDQQQQLPGGSRIQQHQSLQTPDVSMDDSGLKRINFNKF